MKPEELVAALVKAVRSRVDSNLSADALLLGVVGQLGAQGGNLALVSKLKSELPDACAAFAINNYCASSLTAIGQAASMVTAKTCQTVLAGGVEMMSRVPFLGDAAHYYTDTTFPQRTRFLPVALAADRLAEDLDITRDEMDEAALMSQTRAAAAEGTDLVGSRISVNGLDREECLRKTTRETLAALEPAFAPLADQYREVLGREIDHRHTIAHAPPICDGASLSLVGAEGAVDASPRARIVAWAEAGGDPQASLTTGISAMERVLERSGLALDDMDRIEFMEAFAVAMVKFMRDWRPPMDKVNVGGGHLAKGHPLGATGGILLSSLVDALDVAKGRYGLVVATGASGIGSAMIIERIA